MIKSLFKRISARDAIILQVLNNHLNCIILDKIFLFITYLGSSIFAVSLTIITFFIPNKELHSFSIKLCISLFISTLLAQIIKKNVNRIRPYINLTDINVKKIGIDNYSFPSGHTNAAFTIAIMITKFFPHFAIISIALAFLVGMSRMYFGVHYPTDIFVGILLGTFSSNLVFYIF